MYHIKTIWQYLNNNKTIKKKKKTNMAECKSKKSNLIYNLSPLNHLVRTVKNG